MYIFWGFTTTSLNANGCFPPFLSISPPCTHCRKLSDDCLVSDGPIIHREKLIHHLGIVRPSASVQMFIVHVHLFTLANLNNIGMQFTKAPRWKADKAGLAPVKIAESICKSPTASTH